MDMIDFPCSDDWLEWYHRRGLTSRRPVNDRTDELIREIRELKELLRELLEKPQYVEDRKLEL